jgi:uncharacterized paraquat-inducible protein A
MKVNKKVKRLVKSNGWRWKDFLEEFEYDYYDFYTDATVEEYCPHCENTVEIPQKKVPCPSCKVEIHPCSNCPLLAIGECDWDKKYGCSAFP